MHKYQYPKNLRYSAGIFVFLVGFLAGWVFTGSTAFSALKNARRPFVGPSDGSVQIRDQGDSYRFINPLLFCAISENKEFSEFKPMEQDVLKLLDEKSLEDEDMLVSVYYREIDTGRWFGINQNRKYSPASMLKVPIMIAYFQNAESDPEMFSKRIYYDGSFNYNVYEYFKPARPIEPGHSYTVEELIEAMIVYSDNNAMWLLHENIDKESLDDAFTDLGLSVPPETGVVDFMSVKNYAFFFRLLYNSSYLSRDLSEKALEILNRARFPFGIAGGLPPYVTLSQKFGERAVKDKNGEIIMELHDCGIVYHPEKPYLLCMMTKGKSFEHLSETIQDISRYIFNTVSKKD